MTDKAEAPLTVSQILDLPLHVVEIDAQDMVQTPRKDLYLNIPHHGRKNILFIGSDECFACLMSSKFMAGQAQSRTKCLVYKIDNNAEKNKHILAGLFGINYRIPKYFIELESTQLVPWDGQNMSINQMCHDLQS
jgi:hypothetical protein